MRDFPPDETGLLGAAQGFAQIGLLPIVEIPYAKVWIWVLVYVCARMSMRVTLRMPTDACFSPF